MLHCRCLPALRAAWGRSAGKVHQPSGRRRNTLILHDDLARKIPERLSSRQKDHKNMSADTETLARKVREEVIKPEQSTLISPDRQSPILLRREATVEPRFELFH